MHEEFPQVCISAGCSEPHRHPVTGEPPDRHLYKWTTGPDGKPAVKTTPQWRPRKPPRSQKAKENWLYKTADVARVFGVCRQTVLIWIQKGLLPVVRTAGGHNRILGKDLIAFYEKQDRHP